MDKRIIYIHGNQTLHWSTSWAKWFKEELDKRKINSFFETFPDSIIARKEYWLVFLKEYVKAGENDILVGWSSGGVAALRYAELNKIHGSIIVSANYTDLNDEFEKQSGYYNDPWNWEKIRKNQEKSILVFGDNDPYIPQSEFEFIGDKLQSQMVKIPNGKHFIEFEQFPTLLDLLLENFI